MKIISPFFRLRAFRLATHVKRAPFLLRLLRFQKLGTLAERPDK